MSVNLFNCNTNYTLRNALYFASSQIAGRRMIKINIIFQPRLSSRNCRRRRSRVVDLSERQNPSFSIAGKRECALILLRADRAYTATNCDEASNGIKRGRKERTLRQCTRYRNRRYHPFRNIASAVPSQVRLE